MRNTTVVAEHRRSSVHSAGLRMFGHTQTVGLLQAVGIISGDLRRCVCRRTRNQMERLRQHRWLSYALVRFGSYAACFLCARFVHGRHGTTRAGWREDEMTR